MAQIDPQHPMRGRLEALAAGDGDAWRVVFDEAPLGIAVVDLNGRIVRANPALGALAGRSDEVPAPGTALTDLVHPDNRAALTVEIGRVGRMPAGRTGLELRLGSAEAAGDGDEAGHAPVVMASVTPLAETDGTVVGAVVRMIDITRHRALETQFAQTQKMQAVGQLAGGIAHDFNNLLTAIVAATDMSLERIGSNGVGQREAGQREAGQDEATRADLVHIRRSAERGAALVRQLLAFGRKQTLQPRVIALNAAIEDVASLLRRLLGQRVTIGLELDQPGSLVRVDPVQFDQVVVNLALNGRDAMPQGGRLSIRTGAVTLYRPLVRGQEVIPPGRYAMVEVADTGNGIRPEHLDRLFEPFFTTRREQGGTGLGLAMVYGIVRQTDGFIAVESTLGEGTTFRVYLPRHEGTMQPDPPAESLPVRMHPSATPVPDLVQLQGRIAVSPAPPVAEPARSSAPAQREPLPQTRGTLLLVEDEDAVRRLTARGLSLAGWRVLAAESGEAALALLGAESEPPAVLVSDVSMPGMDGPSLVRALRARLPSLPIILVSGYAESEAIADLPGAPVHFLPKPFTLKDLVARIDALVP